MCATATILAAADETRLHKVVEEMRTGGYQVTLTFRSDGEVRGRVQHTDGRVYDCTITRVGTFCSCPDALYRRRICKHAVLLALYELSTPPSASHLVQEDSPQEIGQRPELKLVKVRPGFVFPP
ncbi:MAG TPA: SWIM zinc finger family protein [Candidatus Binatia bacterium]|jgi:hypothetical protein|nr:SWIM zinc finger family protein [Candidatus Binatia bacterium]